MNAGEITAQDAVDILDLIESAGIEVFVDGGWGVDALLGRQTRPHLDLDIALPSADLPTLRRLLIISGFAQIQTPDTWEHNFVVQDEHMRRIDVHSYILDAFGNNAGGVAYFGHHLTGTGFIGGQQVRCIPPDVMVEFHLGYEPDEFDYADVRALCSEFGLPLPEIYNRFR